MTTINHKEGRIIKFRAWNKEKKEMVYGVDLYDSGLPFEGINDNPYEFDAKTLGQFTGLLDKNGKEIYEGDLLRWIDWEQEGLEDWDLYKVEWNEGRYDWLIYRDKKLLEVEAMNDTENFEIIGNIHENPELLEGRGR